MEKLSTERYQQLVSASVAAFWHTRNSQSLGQKVRDQGTRGAVTGGKQLDGFIELLAVIAKDLGIPEGCIYTRKNYLPGFFRPSKNWDLTIISPKQHLIAAVEFKSQVGSFGNNFNNRVEEALGSAGKCRGSLDCFKRRWISTKPTTLAWIRVSRRGEYQIDRKGINTKTSFSCQARIFTHQLSGSLCPVLPKAHAGKALQFYDTDLYC